MVFNLGAGLLGSDRELGPGTGDLGRTLRVGDIAYRPTALSLNEDDDRTSVSLELTITAVGDDDDSVGLDDLKLIGGNGKQYDPQDFSGDRWEDLQPDIPIETELRYEAPTPAVRGAYLMVKETLGPGVVADIGLGATPVAEQDVERALAKALSNRLRGDRRPQRGGATCLRDGPSRFDCTVATENREDLIGLLDDELDYRVTIGAARCFTGELGARDSTEIVKPPARLSGCLRGR